MLDVGPRWRGEDGATGTVAVVGMGKIGLPLAAQYASAGWRVIGVDVLPALVDDLNAGRFSSVEEPGLPERLASAHDAGLFTATLSHADAAREADVVVMIVPLMLTDEQEPDHRHLDAATRAVGEGLQPGALVIYETTLVVGDTRIRFAPALERTSGLEAGDAERGFLVAFSPERVYSGRVFRDLEAYPKLVGGIDQQSAERAVAFYRSVLDAEIWDLGSAETAELAKLAETTYRDVNIALANELARFAERAGVDVLEAIRAANSQPFSHIHEPGIGVGGHCIPVYPHFLLARAPDLQLPAVARRINDGQIGIAVGALQRELGSLDGVPVLVLGLTYREGVKELAYSRAVPLIERLRFHGAQVLAYDPLLSVDEISRLGAEPYRWGGPTPAEAIVVQTADPRFAELDPAWFPALRILYDGRNRLAGIRLPDQVRYVAVGRPAPPTDDGTREHPVRRAAVAGGAGGG